MDTDRSEFPACGHLIADTCEVCWEWWERELEENRPPFLEAVMLGMVHTAAHVVASKNEANDKWSGSEWHTWCSAIEDVHDYLSGLGVS